MDRHQFVAVQYSEQRKAPYHCMKTRSQSGRAFPQMTPTISLIRGPHPIREGRVTIRFGEPKERYISAARFHYKYLICLWANGGVTGIEPVPPNESAVASAPDFPAKKKRVCTRSKRRR